MTESRRILFVHAHPDDECISTGATMARYAAEGAHVTLLTCTLGEEGEVLVPELEHLAAAKDDALGPQRVTELAAAMAVLGVTDHRFLGGAGRWRDSGMMGEPSNDRADCFWRADLLEASAEVAAVIRELRPQVLVTYDTNGGYGHPDHIQAHRVATYGAALAAAPAFRPEVGPAWDVPKIYWTGFPRRVAREGLAALAESGDSGFFGLTNDQELEELTFLMDDAVITARMDGVAYEPEKMDALRAHRTQVVPDGEFFEMAAKLGPELMGYEYFALVKGTPSPSPDSPDGWETDLFAGISAAG